MKKEISPKTIAIDFDGCITTNSFPYIGDPVENCIHVLKKLQDAGHTLILLTMRENHLLDDAEEYIRNNGIEMQYSNCNPTFETGSRKVYASLYVDDHGLGIPLIHDEEIHPKPFVDWMAVEKLLEEKGYL